MRVIPIVSIVGTAKRSFVRSTMVPSETDEVNFTWKYGFEIRAPTISSVNLSGNVSFVKQKKTPFNKTH